MEVKRFIMFFSMIMLMYFCKVSEGNIVMKVQNKFKRNMIRPTRHNLTAMRAHDIRRHGRLLAAVDLPLGGDGSPSSTGLYYTKIGVGTPPKDYYVHVDTGSDILWLNCAGCTGCPNKTELDIKLDIFDPKASSTSTLIPCNQDFCLSVHNQNLDCRSDLLCEYNLVYGDGSSTRGYFVEDEVHLNQVTGNMQNSSMAASVILGCSTALTAQTDSDQVDTSNALDGLLGFGQANSSMLSQLASSKKVKKIFSHCLDGNNGGGIFAIGELVKPKIKTTSIVPNQVHYNVIVKAVEVGGHILPIGKDAFNSGDEKGAIIDSGTTLTFLPGMIYTKMMSQIMASQPALKLQTVEEVFSCFEYGASVDEGFPLVKFHFNDSLILSVYPHEYLFKLQDDRYCFGWQNSELTATDGKQMFLLGDLVLQNKLVLYDLENQQLGWVDYNCSSSIQVKDEKTGSVYSVGPHDLGSTSIVVVGRLLTFCLLLMSIVHSFL